MPRDPLLRVPETRRTLDELHDVPVNFDVSQRESFTAEQGWRFDRYCQPLPPEPPGPPVAGGTWAVARRLVRDYEFADPGIVRAVYHPDRPLPGREMLLRGRFYGLRFSMGVRVGGVVDEVRRVGSADVRVWGWNYRTLQGHLEMGQMDFEVWKWLPTGAVDFRISAFSRPASIPNPLVRLGFRLFGRWMQLKFVHRACERVLRMTEAALRDDGSEGAGAARDERIDVLPAHDEARGRHGDDREETR